eukprot:2056338-Amphidinium_carterae.1
MPPWLKTHRSDRQVEDLARGNYPSPCTGSYPILFTHRRRLSVIPEQEENNRVGPQINMSHPNGTPLPSLILNPGGALPQIPHPQ